MRVLTVSLFALVAVAACSPAADKKGASPTEPAVVANGGGDGVMRPGQWRTTVTITSMTIPGLPPAAAAKMKTRPFSSEECVTSRDMDDYLNKRATTDANAKCSVNKMSHGGGHIEGQSTCDDGEGGSHTVHMTGTYAADHVDMTVNVEGAGARGAVNQTMSLKSERIGDCPG